MSGWLSVAITVILVVVAYLVLNRTIRARTSQQAALDEVKREVGAIITELNATTERNIELIEDRIASLERLIEQADKRVGALRRDLAAHQGESGTYSRLGRQTASPGASRARQPGSEYDAARPDATTGGASAEAPGFAGDGAARPGDRGVRPGDGLPPGSGPAQGRAGGGEDAAADAGGNARDRVRRLYLQGLPLPRIAAIVGKTVGEVELIVALDEGAEE